MPDLLTPGIIAKIWNTPIIIILLTFKSDEIFFLNSILSEKYNKIPNNNV